MRNPLIPNIIRRCLGPLAVAAALAFYSPPASSRPLDEVLESKVLRVAVYEDNPPFSSTVDSKPVGIDVDLAVALARELGVELQILARMQGENVDQDLRVNVWRGTISGGVAADVMLHVPLDPELGLRNREVVLTNAYFTQRITMAVAANRPGSAPTLDSFRSEKVGVQFGSAADYALMFALDGALRNNIVHFVKLKDGVRRFAGGEFSAMFGVRAELEGLLDAAGAQVSFKTEALPGITRASWTLGMAVKENSRDLGYRLAQVLEKLVSSGELAAICKKHGVTYAPPELPQ